jgi:hypothetical protein
MTSSPVTLHQLHQSYQTFSRKASKGKFGFFGATGAVTPPNGLINLVDHLPETAGDSSFVVVGKSRRG